MESLEVLVNPEKSVPWARPIPRCRADGSHQTQIAEAPMGPSAIFLPPDLKG